MNRIFNAFLCAVIVLTIGCQPKSNYHNTENISPDAQIKLKLAGIPTIGNSGKIKIFDAANDSLIDVLDMSIPPGPTERYTGPKAPYTPEPYTYKTTNFTNANTKPGTPSGLAEPTSSDYQLTIIGRFTDGFHFYPIIIEDSTAIITLHHNLLDYNKTYYMTIDDGVLQLPDHSFHGIEKGEFQYTTKAKQPETKNSYTVSHLGDADFYTLQGALDFIPDFSEELITIHVAPGKYNEIIYFRNKHNVKIIGAGQDETIIRYANREVFNPHPVNVSTNEWPGTFPSRRATFMADNCKGVTISNMTIHNLSEWAQAEGLLINGSENVVKEVTIIGSGDALQSNGSCYYENCTIKGWGDTILGRGPAFFKDCELISAGPFMWIRNTDANHGNVFVNCVFKNPEEGKETVIARAPDNKGYQYPYAEAVLINCQLSGISPKGWGQVGENVTNLHYWEYNSTSLATGEKIDISERHPSSRQLAAQEDSTIIDNYQNPAFVLGDWAERL